MSIRKAIDRAKWLDKNITAFSCYVTLLLLVIVIGTQIVMADDKHLSSPPLLLSPIEFSNVQDCAAPANPIVAENCLPGTHDWFVEASSLNISGFVSSTSVNKGGNITLYVNTEPATQFDLNIYRIGYYGGMGGRRIESIQDLKGIVQPACVVENSTGLMSCANWQPSYSFTIPNEWVSGMYVATLTLPDGGRNYVIFVVRDDDRDAAILYQQSVATYQAYNGYGGKSIYNFNSGDCQTVSGMARGVKVSFNRPYYQSLGMQDFNMFEYAEYPFVSWLEQQGYDTVYSTNIDTHNSGKPGAHNELRDHKIFLVSGHDEYWSAEMRDAITDARDNGVNIGFFSSNTGYWRVRLEPDPITGEQDRTMVGYKTTESGGADPSGIPTGTWRDPQGSNDPENGLVGIQYTGDNDDVYFPLRITSEEAKDKLYRHTSLQQMPDNSYIDIGQKLIGWEWDTTFDNGHSPDNLTVLASSPTTGALLTDAGRYYVAGIAQSSVTRYIAASGSLVFSTGTNQWAFGLAVREPNPIIQQVTYNILSDMGIQPATPNSALVLDSNESSSEITKPLEPIISNSDTTAPTINDIQLSVTGTNVTFTWKTDEPVTSTIWIRISQQSEYLITFPPNMLLRRDYHDSDLQTSHQVTLDNFVPNASYSYFIVASDQARNTTVSKETSFETSSDSIVSSLKAGVKPFFRDSGCWLRANQTGSVILGVLGVVIVILLIAPTVILRRRRRMARSSA